MGVNQTMALRKNQTFMNKHLYQLKLKEENKNSHVYIGGQFLRDGKGSKCLRINSFIIRKI